MTLFEWLIAHYPAAKRQTLRRMVEDGRVTINGQRARSLKQPVAETDQVAVVERGEKPVASVHPLRILHEDEDVLVAFKPAGLLTSTVPREKRPTAIAIIRAYFASQNTRVRAGVIHRLDRDASGILVFSKNDAAYASLKRQFLHRTVDRAYTAAVHGHPQEKTGRIESLLAEHADGTVHSTTHRRKGQEAVTEYKVIHEVADPPMAVLRVTLLTGRKHQIRAHLSEAGHPIVGDPVYGRQFRPDTRLLLSATELAFDQPRSGERLSFIIPPPREIEALLASKE